MGFKGLLPSDKTGLANIHRKHNRARRPARALMGSDSHMGFKGMRLPDETGLPASTENIIALAA